MQPTTRPQRPFFSSGPCMKRAGWSTAALNTELIGRSHRSAEGRERLGEVISRCRTLLEVPADWQIGIVPASDTGAVEMALWSLIGARGVDMLAWESFGLDWAEDVTKQLMLGDVRVLTADYGALPDLKQVDPDRDVVFTWNGTTSGVRIPDGNWIALDRTGLTICDAASAAFAMDLPWEKLDATTFSWQKALGGEGQHGMLVLSPRAVERLERYAPPWPLPKIFRLAPDGKLNEDIFNGSTINTPSMLAVSDVLDSLTWAEEIGGLPALIKRSEANLAAVSEWEDQSNWATFLATDPKTRSPTAICLRLTQNTDEAAMRARVKRAGTLLATERAAYDISSYRTAPPGFRIWGGPTVELEDLSALLPWLDWAWTEAASVPE